MDQVPGYVSLIFILTTATTFGFIYFSTLQTTKRVKSGNPRVVGVVILGWLGLLAFLANEGFFMNFDTFPPRLFLALGVPLVVILFLVVNGKTRSFILKMPITVLTYLHIVRVPVEIVLWWMFLGGMVPQLMTFEGVNYDILSGVTAPFIGIFAVGFRHKRTNLTIIWNVIALALLFNIVGHAILSVPSPFQQFAFDQPNIGVFYFPFIWLPGFIVPAVLFAHIVSLMKLLHQKSNVS